MPTSKRSLQSLLQRHREKFQPPLYRHYKGRTFRYVYDTDVLVARSILFTEVRYRSRAKKQESPEGPPASISVDSSPA